MNEEALVWLLNSAPVIDGTVAERLDDGPELHALSGGPRDLPMLRGLRDDLHGVIRGSAAPAVLAPYLEGVAQRPSVGASGVDWELEGATPAALLVLEWARVERELPGRLKACANLECNKFLIDHSRPNSGRWCSMAECGNRLKARRHRATIN